MEKRQMQDSFGSLLRYFREQKGLSLVELSNRCEISPSYINRLETNSRRCPTYVIIKKLSEGLGIDVGLLIDYEVEKIEQPISISELLLTKDYAINGKKSDNYQKEKLVYVLETIFNSDFRDEYIFEQGFDILMEVQELLEIIN